MDKRTVIAAYRRGSLTLRECAQILGMETELAAGLVDSGDFAPTRRGAARGRQPVGG